MGGVNLPQLLLNADFCEQDELVQKRGEKRAKRNKRELKISIGERKRKGQMEMSTNSMMSWRAS